MIAPGMIAPGMITPGMIGPGMIAPFRLTAALAPPCIAAILGGCVANSSNPVIRIESAAMSANEARITLDVSNPGGRNLDILGLSYELAHGEMSFPVAHGAWEGSLALPAGDSVRLPLAIAFESALFEPDSLALHLSGELETRDLTGFLGIPSMELGATSFQLDTVAVRLAP